MIPLFIYFLLFLLAAISYNAKGLQESILGWMRKRKFAKSIYGPPTLPIIGNIHQYPSDSFGNSEFLITMANEALAKGESVLRFWTGPRLTVMVLSGQAAKPLLENQVELRKGFDYDFHRLWIGDGLLTSDGNKWRTQRKLLTPIFHFSMLETYMAVINRHTNLLCDHLFGKMQQIHQKSLLLPKNCHQNLPPESNSNVSKSEGVLNDKDGNHSFNGDGNCTSNLEVPVLALDMFPLLKLCALDIVMESTMGLKLDAIRHQEGGNTLAPNVSDSGNTTKTTMSRPFTSKDVHEYANAVQMFNAYAFEVSYRPYYWWAWSRWLLGYSGRVNACLNSLHSFTNKAIKLRLENRNQDTAEMHASISNKATISGTETIYSSRKTKPFLDMLLELYSPSRNDVCSGEKQNPNLSMVEGDENRQQTAQQNLLLLDDIRQLVDTFIFAGHDTTAHGLAWTVWCLATHPEAQKRVHDELCQLLGDPPSFKSAAQSFMEVQQTIHQKEQTQLDASMLGQMKYLDMCIREAMRLFPPVPVVERNLHSDLELGGRLVPSGTDIVISPLIIHHNANVYPDYNSFNPDNFLSENVALRHPYDYIPFMAGPRNCIGQRFAQFILKSALAQLFWRFRFQPHPASLKLHDNRRANEVILRPALGVPVSISFW